MIFTKKSVILLIWQQSVTQLIFLHDKGKNIRKAFTSLYHGIMEDRNSRISQVR